MKMTRFILALGLALLLALTTAPITSAATALPTKFSSVEASNIIHRVDTIDALRLFTGNVTGKKAVQVMGYYTAGDGGGGPVRRWDAASTCTDDGGACIDPAAAGAGRWVWGGCSPIDVRSFGAKASNSNADAAANYAAIKKAINYISATGTTGVLFFPAGTYFTYELRDADGLDFRYVSFLGEGPRRSILKLADGRNLPLIDTGVYFETSLRDMQFNGNKTNNPTATEIVKFTSGNVYAIQIDNVYFRDGAGDGLSVNGGQHFTLNHVMGKYCGGWGLRFNGSESVQIIHPDAEQNTLGGILLQADPTNTPLLYRYYNPNIIVENPYVEANPIGIELRSISGVEVSGGYRNAGTFMKISADLALSGYSHYNRVRGTWEGKIIIEPGCYGNYVDTPFFNSRNTIDDQDGRNAIGPFATPFIADRHSHNFNGAAIGGNPATNMSTWSTTTGSGHTLSKVSASVLPAALAYNATESGPRSLRMDVAGVTSSTISVSTSAPWPTNATGYVYVLCKVSSGAKLGLEMYDLADPGYYNFAAKGWVASTSVETTLNIPTNGEVQLFKIPVEVGEIARRWRPKFYVYGNAGTTGRADFYYCLLADTDNLGLLHYSGGSLIGRGELPIFTDATRPPATAIPAGSMIWNTSDSAPNYSNGASWLTSAGEGT